MKKVWISLLTCTALVVALCTNFCASTDTSSAAETGELPMSISNADWNDHRQFVKLDTGITMAYVEMGKADGEAIILVHGYSDNSRTWYYLAPYLAEAGYHVYMIDQRGHGQTDKPYTGYYSQSDYASDLNSFMDKLGIEKANIIGHSMGGGTAQVFALNYPERCDKIVLEGAVTLEAGMTSIMSNYEMGMEIGKGNYPTAETLGSWYTYGRAMDDEFQEFLDYMLEDTLKIPGEAWMCIVPSIFSVNMELFYPLIDQDIPILIMYGEDDVAVDQTTLHPYLPQAEYLSYPGVTHNIQFDAPEQMAKDVVAFFAD